MIVFVPAYDPSTRSNLAVAREVVNLAEDTFLGAGDATGAALDAVLAQSSAPLLAFAHGGDDCLWAQGGSAAAPAVSDQDVGKLGPRTVFAFACLTANVLGCAAAAVGTVWWGFAKQVTAPSDDPRCAPMFRDIFRFIRMRFAEARTPAERAQFFRDLQACCDGALDRLNEGEGGDPTPLEAHHAVLQIRRDLMVWIPGADQAETAPPL